MPTTAEDYIRAFGALGGGLGAWGNSRRISGALDALGPDATFQQRAEAIMRINPDLGVKMLTAGALGDYRTGMLEVAQDKKPLDVRIYEDWKASNPGGPSYVAPPDTASAADAAEEAEASGVPGTAYTRPSGVQMAQNDMPNVIAEKLKTPRELAREKAAGGLDADRADYEAKRGIFGQRADAVMEDLFKKLKGYDDFSIENALGPLQGADQEGWRATLQNIPQMFGEAKNSYWDGGDNSTYEVRGTIKGSINALTNAIKPFVRIKGDVWSDKDQALLTSILGGLQEAQNRPELYRRFNDAVDRINAAWGFNIGFRAPEANPDARANNSTVEEPKTAERYTAPEEVPGPTTGGMSGVNENTMVGGVNIGRTTSQPPTPPARALNALRAYKNNPQARAAFDEIYGPGASDFYLQKYR